MQSISCESKSGSLNLSWKYKEVRWSRASNLHMVECWQPSIQSPTMDGKIGMRFFIVDVDTLMKSVIS
uniref:Uncharacterized protein n=1 Tax=Musa acuminata subsp. malaccensis TaxID=214687 RepID=A0A804L8B5_MUSAM